jgi:hypothetical protein
MFELLRVWRLDVAHRLVGAESRARAASRCKRSSVIAVLSREMQFLIYLVCILQGVGSPLISAPGFGRTSGSLLRYIAYFLHYFS